MGRECASERGVRESSRVSRLGLAPARDNARTRRPPRELEPPASLRGEAQKRPRRGRLVGRWSNAAKARPERGSSTASGSSP